MGSSPRPWFILIEIHRTCTVSLVQHHCHWRICFNYLWHDHCAHQAWRQRFWHRSICLHGCAAKRYSHFEGCGCLNCFAPFSCFCCYVLEHLYFFFVCLSETCECLWSMFFSPPHFLCDLRSRPAFLPSSNWLSWSPELKKQKHKDTIWYKIKLTFQANQQSFHSIHIDRYNSAKWMQKWIIMNLEIS